MIPTITFYNFMKIFIRDAKSICHRSHGDTEGKESSKLSNVSFCELGSSIFRSFSLSVFPNHIIHVVLAGSRKKMINIDAKFMIAFMTDMDAIQDRSVGQKPNISMDEPYLSLDTYNPISAINLMTIPNYTSRHGPKGFFYNYFFDGFVRIMRCATTISGTESLWSARERFKGFIARRFGALTSYFRHGDLRKIPWSLYVATRHGSGFSVMSLAT